MLSIRPLSLVPALALSIASIYVHATEELYQQHCAVCHDKPDVSRAPSRTNLEQMPASRILKAMEFGRMQPQAAAMAPAQREALAMHLAAVGGASRDEWIAQNRCAVTQTKSAQGAAGKIITAATANWGFGDTNTRYLRQGVNINRRNVKQLSLAWSLAIPGATEMRSQPVVSGSKLYLGTANGNVLALDQATGCVHWQFRANSTVRSALNLDTTADGIATLYFADDLGTVYAVNARTGIQRWQKSLRWFPTSVISGSLAFHQDVLYVPLSSFEVAAAGLDSYPCCRSHGGVAALNAVSGETVWEYHNTRVAEKTSLNKAGTQMWGPSGAAIWTTPAIDAGRGVLYVGSGENTSLPATATSDAVIALDLHSGERRWLFQALENDVWNGACQLDGANCPPNSGPDFDFGGAITLARDSKGKEYVLAGQKSGELFALDPDKRGKLIWRQRLSQGTSNGGIHWGVATDGRKVYVTIADPDRDVRGYTPRPGIYAVALKTGQPIWSQPVSRGCELAVEDKLKTGLAEMRTGKARDPWPKCSYYYGQSAAPLLAGKVLYAGALDGKLRLLDSRNGKVLRIIDTKREYEASNNISGHGGAIDLSGVLVSGKYLIVSSGYGMFGQMPGNMLLAFTVE